MILANPKIYFCQRAWIKTCEEASRWCEIGLQEQKVPFEAVIYPLMYAALRPGHERCPAEMIELQDISFAVATHVAIPDDYVKNYSSGHANFQKEGVDIEGYSDLFAKKRISPLIRRYPLIDVISRLHSHPFSKKAGNSSGDLITIRNDGIGAREKGFNFSFSFIITPKTKKVFADWNISCFAVTAGQEIPLAVELIPDDHPIAKKALRQPYYKKYKGRRWEREFELYIGGEFERYRKRRNPRGWTSFWLKKTGWEIVLYLPPLFPSESARMFVSERGKDFQEKISPFTPGLFPDLQAENMLDHFLDR